MQTCMRAAPWLGLLLLPAPALAQDTALPASTEAAAATVEVPAPGPEPEPLLWTASVSAGISVRDDGPDGYWQSMSLSRTVGKGYVRGSLMRYHGTLLQADLALPSDYYVGTLGAGGNFDNWVVDGWVSYGRQVYGRISTPEGKRKSTGAQGSDYYAIGGDFGRVLSLGSGFYLTPTVTASFANGKLLRPAQVVERVRDQETGEPTWSANAAMRIDHAFGASGVNYAGLSISRNWTSNGLSELRLRRNDDPDAAMPFRLDSKHYADSWFEVGATANMKLTRGLYLDLFTSRSFGMKAGNVTSAGAALRLSF
ncbi:autotransporter domain-containing protein [Novosphingobium resinovorum]|uniref:autotransporter domain-containing protein n=1 Tax=Novosphingobium resinovorum TaxID=158500 RepID=UPI002ED25217|nr:autotransporter domain-containing protein [Novosphingobium resinovorum]